MNCKQGDLAMLIRSMARNEGKIVRCVRVAPHDEYSANRVTGGDLIWLIDPPLVHDNGVTKPYARDAWLRPIRPQPDDAVDETLLWLPIPFNTEETV